MLCYKKYFNSAKLLISNVININIQNGDGETLLHQICQQKENIDEEKRKELILLLLEKGANHTIKDKVILFFLKK